MDKRGRGGEERWLGACRIVELPEHAGTELVLTTGHPAVPVHMPCCLPAHQYGSLFASALGPCLAL